MTTFFVPGVPAPQGSKRHVGNGIMVESSRGVAPWRTAVAYIARARRERFDTAIHVQIEFIMPRPKRLGKTRQEPMTQKPDVDKLIRSTLDGLTTSGIIPDDSYVTHVEAEKRRANYSEDTGAKITIQDTQEKTQ